MFYWFLFLFSLAVLFWIFWRRYVLTKRGLKFEEELKKEEESLPEKENEDNFVVETLPTELQLKRREEQRMRDEKTRKIKESKKAFKQAEIYFSKKDYGLAEKELLQVLSFDNDHLDANLKLGLLYLHQENLPRAEFFFQKLIDLKENPVYYSNLALTLYQQNRLPEAAKLYEKSIALDNKRAVRFVSLAHIYGELGESEKALQSFEAASQLEPRNLEYLQVLAGYYEKFSRKTDLKRILQRILNLDPYNQEVKEKLVLLEERETE